MVGGLLHRRLHFRSSGATGWWVVAGKTCVAAYQAKGAASLAASYSNLANPGTYDLGLGVAPTWAAETGWTFNGTTQYLTTGITVASTAWSFFVRFANVTAANGGCGQYTTTNSEALLRPNHNGQHTYGMGGERTVTGGLTNVTMGVAGLACYKDGASDGTITATGPTNGSTLHIGRINYTGAHLGLTGDVLCVALYSDTLTGAEAATLSASMAAL